MSACEHYQQQISQLLDGELPPEPGARHCAHICAPAPNVSAFMTTFCRFRPPSVTRPPRRPPT